MKQTIEMRLDFQLEQNEEIDPEILAESLDYPGSLWSHSLQDGLRYTLVYKVHPYKFVDQEIVIDANMAMHAALVVREDGSDD